MLYDRNIIDCNLLFNLCGEIFSRIEVKKATSKAGTGFFVIRNELEISKEYKNIHFIYRVYDVKGLYPKFYKAAW